MRTFKPHHRGPRNDPRFAAIEEDGLNYRLIEPGGNKRRDVFAPKNLPNVGSGGAGFPYLSADRLDIVIILGHEASQVLKNFDLL
jgi:hypothetical protein